MSKDLTPEEAKDVFWETLKDHRTVMMGSDSTRHMQPMTGFGEREEGVIYFYTRDDTDLAKSLETGGEAMICLMSKDEKVHACIAGRAGLTRDREAIDENWNFFVSAWFPDGKDDPALTLIRFEPTDGKVWAQNGGAVRFLFETTKANLTGDFPDEGDVVNVRF